MKPKRIVLLKKNLRWWEELQRYNDVVLLKNKKKNEFIVGRVVGRGRDGSIEIDAY